MPTKTADRARAYPPITHPTPDEKHVMDYVRVVYRRRWIALPVFLIVFVIGAVWYGIQSLRNRRRGIETQLMYQMLPPD